MKLCTANHIRNPKRIKNTKRMPSIKRRQPEVMARNADRWNYIPTPMICRSFAIQVALLVSNYLRETRAFTRSRLESFSSVIISPFAAVAQLDRVLGYEPRGRGFNSCRPHQYKKQQNQRVSATSASPFFFLLWTLCGHFLREIRKLTFVGTCSRCPLRLLFSPGHRKFPSPSQQNNDQ